MAQSSYQVRIIYCYSTPSNTATTGMVKIGETKVNTVATLTSQNSI